MTALGLIDEAGVAARTCAGPGGDGTRPQRNCSKPTRMTAGKRRIRPELWPDSGFVDVGVRGDASELAAARRP